MMVMATVLAVLSGMAMGGSGFVLALAWELHLQNREEDARYTAVLAGALLCGAMLCGYAALQVARGA